MATPNIDVQITLKTSTNVATTSNNRLMVLLEDMSMTSDETPQCIFKTDSSDISTFADYNDNPYPQDFLNIAYQQSQKPATVAIVSGNFGRTKGILTSSALPDFATIKTKYQQQATKDFCMSISVNDVAYKVYSDRYDIANIDSYDELINMMNQYTNNNNIPINFSYINNAIVASTSKSGLTDGKISFATNARYDEVIDTSTLESEAFTATDISGDFKSWFDTVKNYDSKGSFNIQHKDSNEIFNGEFEIKLTKDNGDDLSSTDELAEALNNAFNGVFECEIDATSKKTTITTTEQYKNYEINAGSFVPDTAHAGTSFIDSIFITASKNPTITAIQTAEAESSGAQDLKLRTEDNAVVVVGKNGGTINDVNAFLLSCQEVISQNGIDVCTVVLSRNLTTTTDANGNIISNLPVIYKFCETFKSTIGSKHRCVMICGTDSFVNTGTSTNYFKDLINDSPEAGSVIMCYNGSETTTARNYIDYAIATVVSGINWDTTNANKNTKGQALNGVKATNISDVATTQLETFHINTYDYVGGEDVYFREGLTFSSGDFKWIDAIVGIQAFCYELQKAVIKLIKLGTAKNNSKGGALLYNFISSICNKYYNNGLFDEGEITETPILINGIYVQGDTKYIPPYEIKIEAGSTVEQIQSRTAYAYVNVFIPGFINKISIDISTGSILNI